MEPAADLPIELADGPTAAERLGLVEIAREDVLDAQQADVVGPG